MRQRVALMALTVMAGCTPQAVPSGRTAILDPSDQVFLATAAERTIAALQMEGIAAARGQSPALRQMARQQVAEHRRSLDAEFNLAHDKAMPLPTYSDAPGQAMVRSLQQVSAAHFDSAYLAAVEENLSRSIALFQDAARHARDPDVRGYALVVLPALESHLRQVRELQGALS